MKYAIYFVFLSVVVLANSQLVVAEQSSVNESDDAGPGDTVDSLYLDALRSNDIELLKPQIDGVSDVDLAPANGRTALMFLAKRNRPRLVSRLLRRGANANARNTNGGTPLMYAAIAGNVDIVKALIEAGGDIDARGSNGWSAVMVAAAKGHAELVRYLVSIDVDADAVDVYNWTPLIRASYENRLEVVDVLIESGRVAVNHRDDQGATALHHAAGGGFLDIVERLMLSGADIAITDNSELTPLERATAAGHTDIQKLFCDRLVELTKEGTTSAVPAASKAGCGSE